MTRTREDTELYEGLLGFKAPGSVERVAVDYKQLQVDVFAKHAEGISWPCPECGKASRAAVSRLSSSGSPSRCRWDAAHQLG